MTSPRKKLIEVALPLDAINAASAREKSIRHGHPSTLHLWWARRPLAAARAVIFAQMVDDPSASPELFPTEADQEKERERLFRLIEELVKWENTTNEKVLEQARKEIRKSWRRTCADHADNPRAAELFDPDKFVAALRAELPTALAHLQSGNIAPVDLAQAAIGPGMAVFTRYAKVLDAEGNPVSVREALALINQMLDEVLAEQEGDFDADSRWALAWFEQQGFDEGEYGVAETLSKAKNTSIAGIVEGGILASSAGKVRLLRPDELADDWDPTTDARLTVWEAVHHLIRALETGGEPAAARVVTRLGASADIARELAYRLYTICERKRRAAEALSYNSLVQSWPEISDLARQERQEAPLEQGGLFGDRATGGAT